ncbi:MAG: ribonuclease P protein component [Bacteroidetes bacterium]|nr:ribonuclease P protein component [Bacteroidota bacterium]
MPQTFKKPERLCSRKIIEELFGTGKSFFCYPFRVVWLKTDRQQPYPAQMTPAVSSRNFRKAVTRNIIRRRIKEAYRKNKDSFYSDISRAGIKLVFMFQYTEKEVVGYAEIEKGVITALGKLSEKAVQASDPC